MVKQVKTPSESNPDFEAILYDTTCKLRGVAELFRSQSPETLLSEYAMVGIGSILETIAEE